MMKIINKIIINKAVCVKNQLKHYKEKVLLLILLIFKLL
jgi:hypothetical protein